VLKPTQPDEMNTGREALQLIALLNVETGVKVRAGGLMHIAYGE
jgi:hypothetical protein